MRKTAAPLANFSGARGWLRSSGFGAFRRFPGVRCLFLGGLFFGQRLAQDHGLDIEILVLIEQRRRDRTRLSGVFGVSGFR